MGKRGLSNLVAYVLLIAITISLSVMVYGWLKFYVSEEEVPSCGDNVNIIINGYECVSGTDGYLNVTFKNKGLFTVDGFTLRVHDREDAEFGLYVFDREGVAIRPGKSASFTYSFADFSEKEISDLTLIDVQPFMMEDGKVSCESYASQRVSCS